MTATAVKRISQAREEQATSLDLADLGLEYLPAEIGQLTQLQSLNLQANSLEQLSPEIGQLKQLRKLELMGNRLTQLPPEIGQLKQLQHLDLMDNRLQQLPPEIGQLKQLQNLDLMDNGLEQLPPEIGELTRLHYLDLDGCHLRVFPVEIGQLTQLRTLDLRHNRLVQLPPEIGQLKQLQHLDLMDNRLEQLPPEIGQLKQLQNLDLGGNSLERLPVEIGQLTRLRSLNLTTNGLEHFPSEICQLQQLLNLYLGQNRLELPTEIGRLKQLQTLDLRNNRLELLPPEIGFLKRLRTLNLRSNHLKQLPPEISQLKQLQSLDLSDNQLERLPVEIGQLTQLSLLLLGTNNLKQLPPKIGQLEPLETLDLRNNRLEQLPAEIGQLPRLQTLNVKNNRLEQLPSRVGQLKTLETLDLSNNRLRQLPTEIGQLTQLQKLLLHNNEALGLPPEVLGHELELFNKADPSTLLEFYFRSRTEPSKALMEAKILIVGQGAVGKTSLVNRLVHGDFDPDEPKTEGIDIVRWKIPARDPSEDIRVNIWDFGGQEIMHATHEFFLTRRSLYLLVLDARKGENESNLTYWLRIIQLHGGDAPVLVVTNKAEPPNRLELNETRLKKDYAPNVRGFFSTSCSEDLGFPELQQAIHQEIHRLEHVYNTVPVSFLATKADLEERTESKDYLELSEYEKLCRTHGITKKSDQLLLLRFLHDLGAVLHFADPDSVFPLEETKILNPEWVTHGVYKVLNNNRLMTEGGILTLRSLGEILTESEGYPKNAQLFILGIMQKFELSFEFADGTGRYLVPELLTPMEPELGFDEADALRLEYHYEVLPEGLLPRFIVRTHGYLTDKPTYWRSGVLLQIDENRVMVRGDSQKGRVFVVVAGPIVGRRRALTVVRIVFAGLHRTSSEQAVEERVSLPGFPGESVPYQHLLRLERDGEKDFRSESVDHRFNVQELLRGIESRAQRSRAKEALEAPLPDKQVLQEVALDGAVKTRVRTASPEVAPPRADEVHTERKPQRGWVRNLTIWGSIASIIALPIAFSQCTGQQNSMPTSYSLRAQIFDKDGNPVDGSTIRVSSGEVQLLPNGWWEVAISRASLPSNGEVVLWAEHPRWNTARKALTLDRDPNPGVALRLEIPKQRITGVVIEADGPPIGGARISLLDHPSGASATTDREGRFELFVAGPGKETERILVEHADFASYDGTCLASREGCVLRLKRGTQEDSDKLRDAE